MLNVSVFDRHKLHMVPPILINLSEQVQNLTNTPEVRENYIQRFEAIRDYCNYVLDLHAQIKREERQQKQRKRG